MTTTRTRTRRGLLWAISGVVVVLLAAAGLTMLPSSQVDEIRTLQPDVDITRVEVGIDAGAISLVPAGELTVTIRQYAGRFAGSPSSAADITDGVLRVAASCPRLRVGRCDTAVTVAVPPGVDIHAASDAGSIDGEIVRGNLEARTAAGSITLAVTGEVSHLSATTEAGRVDLVVPDDVYAVDARTSIGRTRVEVDTAADAPRVIQARSEVGRVTIRTREDTP